MLHASFLCIKYYILIFFNREDSCKIIWGSPKSEPAGAPVLHGLREAQRQNSEARPHLGRHYEAASCKSPSLRAHLLDIPSLASRSSYKGVRLHP